QPRPQRLGLAHVDDAPVPVLELVGPGSVGDGAGGRAGQRHIPILAVPAYNGGNAGLVSGDISVPRPTTPWMGDQAVPTGRESELLHRGISHMFRVQAPLPERYTDANPDDLAARIGTAKAALGPRVFVLGHHYQRDEVMRW